MTICFKRLWLFWLGSVAGATLYAIWPGGTLEAVLSGPYWVAFTILAMQCLGVGKSDSRDGDNS